MEIYSDRSIAYNSEGFARLYGWWNDAEGADDDYRPAKKEKKDETVDGTDVPYEGWDEKNG